MAINCAKCLGAGRYMVAAVNANHSPTQGGLGTKLECTTCGGKGWLPE